ncbi:MAG: hypothetical protein IKE73_03065 [Bacilli bacterium]|nr:hypothetical protein [Bacilli bacterium]
MNYAYDLTLNFNKKYIDFYEWNKEDNLEYYVKVPIFKITNDTYYDIFYNEISVSKKFLEILKNQTEKYSRNGIIKCKNIAIFTNMGNSIVLKFDDSGNVILKSSISIDEEEDILSFSKVIKYYLLEYKVNNINKIKKVFITRNELDLKNKINKEINKLYETKEYEKLSYIYYELYGERNENNDKVHYKLINLLENNSDKIGYINDLIFCNKKKSTYI